ncbi:RsfA family transcriptional regulator [Bacillus sp. B15-48]|uniref:RsfA family transcriptional regulator n=1 Tax=Bacillus sp. B15-48 TaxID=1548601 RepID=UPI00193F22F6|nr:RsfA family transcriptional regulator [Bacillus sp. B15-48]MBM4764042.1 RsfA family transcriptional regulator [Bacillus sp. B15-48]
MPITRQDAWTQDEDLLLAETVLRHIKEGGTQLKAFEEVGKRLSRTSAACGFRWNSFVRKQYTSGIELAKKQRKELKKQSKKIESSEEMSSPIATSFDSKGKESIDIVTVKGFIDKLYAKVEKSQSQADTIAKYEGRINELEATVSQLTAEREKLSSHLQAIENDHRALLGIMERAKKIVGGKDDQTG